MRFLRLLAAELTFFAPLCMWADDGQQQPAPQQDQLDVPRSSDPGKQPWVREFVADEIRIWTSPFRKSSYEGRAFKKYVIPFALITGALFATDRQTAELLPNTEDQSKWSLRVSQIGAPYTLAGISGTMYLISRATGNKKARETGFLGALAIGHSQLVTQGLKLMAQRERPHDYRANGSGGLGFWKGGSSFPSGHASSSFALATVFAYEYGQEHRWVKYTGYGIATVVAASRLSGEKHWLSDLFVGSTMGFMIGRYVYKTHHNPRVDATPQRGQRFIPEFGIGRRGLTLTWNLNADR